MNFNPTDNVGWLMDTWLVLFFQPISRPEPEPTLPELPVLTGTDFTSARSKNGNSTVQTDQNPDLPKTGSISIQFLDFDYQTGTGLKKKNTR